MLLFAVASNNLAADFHFNSLNITILALDESNLRFLKIDQPKKILMSGRKG